MHQRYAAKDPPVARVEAEQGPGSRPEEGEFQKQADDPGHRDRRFARSAGVTFDVECPPGRCRQQWDQDHQDEPQPARELRPGPGAKGNQGEDFQKETDSEVERVLAHDYLM